MPRRMATYTWVEESWEFITDVTRTLGQLEAQDETNQEAPVQLSYFPLKLSSVWCKGLQIMQTKLHVNTKHGDVYWVVCWCVLGFMDRARARRSVNRQYTSQSIIQHNHKIVIRVMIAIKAKMGGPGEQSGETPTCRGSRAMAVKTNSTNKPKHAFLTFHRVSMKIRSRYIQTTQNLFDLSFLEHTAKLVSSSRARFGHKSGNKVYKLRSELEIVRLAAIIRTLSVAMRSLFTTHFRSALINKNRLITWELINVETRFLFPRFSSTEICIDLVLKRPVSITILRVQSTCPRVHSHLTYA